MAENIAGRGPIPHRDKILVAAVGAALTLGTVQASQAQAQGQRSWQLEEVTVTARKREESLQDAPIAISAFSGDGLEARGITRLIEIGDITPNLTFQNNPSFGGASSAAAVYIRGIGQKEFLPTVEPGVGIYVDGIYVARSVGAIFDLVEVEQVEVLRGPQGTLFGRNTIGGAISITTRKPEQQWASSLEATMGSDSRLDLKGMVNVPFTDSLAGRFNLASFQRDGYVTRVHDGKDLGDDDTLTGRAAFLWDVTPDLEVNVSAGFTKDNENGSPVRLIGINYAGPIDPDTPPLATIHNVGASLAAGGPEAPCIIPGVTGTVNTAVPACYDDRYLGSGDRNYGTAPTYAKVDLYHADTTISWHLSERLQLKSITGYRDLDSHFARDGDGSPWRVTQFVDALDQQQFTQELQFLGNSEDQRLNWILGLYYFDESGENTNTLDFSVSKFVSGGAYDNRSAAAFAQVSYDLSESLTLTGGLRYTDERKRFLPDQYIIQNYFAGTGHPMLDAPFMQAGSRVLPHLEKQIEIEETTPMLNLRWQVTDGTMLYATYSEGFKSGGFSQRVFPPQVAGATAPAGTADIDLIPSFDPEYVTSTELGLKYSSDDNTLRVNAAIFDTRYEDFQIQVFTSVAPVTKNAAEVGITGAELEVTWLFGDGWMLETAAGFLDAGYDDIDTSETFVDAGNDLERVPDTTLSASISKDFNLDSGALLSARLDWSYRADQEMDTFNTAQIAQESYSLLNANVSWRSSDEHYQVTLGGTNLTDEEYLVSGIIGDAFQSYEGVYGRGTQWYLTLRYNY
ncbi:TonB-dependent receptor [Parahaliea mediterranea]|uniref:TonB-dependent receptor n=1 Tax=Parahaliea mediterranea TaxID=651086 RepID=A0A939DGE9_9GAMM|nr:TonB-dependent receptor [Parahaliea mediterranea]MBN7797396.1 TonB-dependent receptor [Parahaliea mediterranea]